MSTTIRFAAAIAALVAAGCVVKVNGKVHKFGVSEEKTENKTDGSAGASNPNDPDALAAELAGGSTPAGQKVTLSGTFAPNPTMVGTFTSKGEVSINGQPHGASNCSGYVGTDAAAVINFTSPMKNTRISAPGAKLILAEFGNRQYTCKDVYGSGVPSVMLDEWPAGEVTIFVGGQKDQSYSYQLKVEDESRPIDILWKDKVKAVEIAEVPKDPIVITQTTPKEAGQKTSRCGDGYFRETPDVVFSLKRPLGDMSIEVRSAKPIDIELVGPLNETGRNLPVQCGSDHRVSFGRMEAGIYGLRIGTDHSADEVLYHVVVGSKETSRNPTEPPKRFADAISLEESVVLWHYPQLGQSDVETSDAHRESLFMSAPKELYVFPKFNMDKSVAEIIGGSSAKSGDKGAALEYPKENEPLLLLNKNGWVVATDGTMFRVNMKDLQADPGGNVVFPAAPRNTSLSFEQALKSKGPEDAKAVAAWEKAEKAAESCYEKARNNVEGTPESICGSFDKAADKQKETLEKELARTRAARRATNLGKIKARVEGLFKK